MKLTRDNLEVIAAKCYLNTSCLSTEEFNEDLNRHKIIKKLARKISRKNSKNLRLLTNHIICFTNNFELRFAKELLFMESDETEKRVIRSVLLFLGFLGNNEYTIDMLDADTIKMLKEMDK
jgi:hypothetical protein